VTGNFFIRGLVVGFSIAAPVGPIGLLCIRRSLTGGPRTGLITGLGAATADAAYGAVAGFGLTAVSGFLIRWQPVLAACGGLFLCYLGARAVLGHTGTVAAGASKPLSSAYLSTFVLTLSNPSTILSFVAVFAAMGLAAGRGASSAAALVAGVFVGSTLWWVLLSTAVGLMKERITPAVYTAVSRACGAMLFLLGALALWTAGA
jgi:threonine/homoserine/homoserine lactone efflux protein